MKCGFHRTYSQVLSRAFRCAMTCAFVAASMPVSAEKDPAARLLEDQRERTRQETIERPSSAILPIPDRPALDADPAEVAESGPMVVDPRIAVDGAGLLGRDAIDDTLASFRGLPLGENRLGLLLRRFDARLVEAGYVTSRTLHKNASADTGEVRNRFQPGQLDGILAPEDSGAVGFTRAFRNERDDVIRPSEVGQGIHQISGLRPAISQ